MRLVLPDDLAAPLREAADLWQREARLDRLWARDASIWTGGDEVRWLGWLDLERQGSRVDAWCAFAREVASAGLTDALLVGMGGSSLCPDVLAETFAPAPNCVRLHVLDSVLPVEIRRAEAALDPARTLLVVSSKSGTTIEADLLARYFRHWMEAAVGSRACEQLVAITDPGSPLADIGRRERFRRVFDGDPDIGGRFSALSVFGLLPAALLGLHVRRLLAQARAMAERCAPRVPIADNPGAHLGLLLGVAGLSGRDKVTFVISPPIAAFGAWAEQLLAESTGKAGRALIPVDAEPAGPADAYARDRLFVYLRDAAEPDPAQDAWVAALARGGHAVVQIDLAGREDLAAEFFRWELAAAVAGAVLGVNPFDQPDVEASKVAARRLAAAYEAAGALPAEEPIAEAGPLRLYADPQSAARLAGALAGRRPSVRDVIAMHLSRLQPPHYFALLAFLGRSPARAAALESIRRLVRDRRRTATTLGFGPRYLHSTGQAHKGGPNTGVFLQLTADDEGDLPVPGRRVTFGAVAAAQARGDFEVLAARGRPIVRVHLGREVDAGLDMLAHLVDDGTQTA